MATILKPNWVERRVVFDRSQADSLKDLDGAVKAAVTSFKQLFIKENEEIALDGDLPGTITVRIDNARTTETRRVVISYDPDRRLVISRIANREGHEKTLALCPSREDGRACFVNAKGEQIDMDRASEALLGEFLFPPI